MEEDTGVKAPVTRLRRRLSVEQSEESKSPALNTPTKRRGRKKPELELIDENTPESPKPPRTRKATVKEAIESVEEKPLTPARRSTRIKSNTSIASETTVAVNSPRAKRATRRTSQIGSDNEAPPTPVRATRRTRKDSTSSIEKVEVAPPSKPPIQITEVIVEEPETNSRKSTNPEVEDKTSVSPNSFRRSPRLVNKQNQSINKTEDVTDQSNSNQETPIEETNEIPQENSTPSESLDTKEAKQDRLSISSSKLIKDLDTKGNLKKNKINLNKSTPVVVLHNVEKIKRNRTKSWTAEKESNESNFFSDNESLKNKIKKNLKSTSNLNVSESKDEQNKSLSLNKSKNSNEINKSIVKDANKSVNSKDIETVEDIQNQSRDKQLQIEDSTSVLYTNPTGEIKTVVVIEDSDSNSGKTNVQDINDSGDQCVPVIEHAEQNIQEVNQFSVTQDHSIRLNKSKNRTITDNSCEPMDVDETIPDSMVITDTETKANDKSRKSFPSDVETNVSNNDKGNKSLNNENKSDLISTHLKNTSDVKSPKPKNKLLSKSAFDLDVTQEETNNKNISLNYLTSTPLQHKSIQKLAMQVNTSIIASNNDSAHVIENMDNNSEKATNASHLNENDLSNKENKNIINTEYEEKMDISVNKEPSKDSSSNKLKKLNLSKNKKAENDESGQETPIKISKNLKSKGSKQNKITSDDSNSDESDNESKESNMLDDEAEDAGNDYQSGDSQNESERRYAEENEIIEKGETLTSESDDLSDDSDYEKDSFVVSSDEEDNELLEGTEDDLSMSDNELKMTAKSKKKYDERKLKEQKRASREMYESRHKIINKTKKKSQQQLSSSEELSESEDESEKPKKNNRMRLDSSDDSEDENETVSQKKTPVLSESVCEEAADEKEMTIAEESMKENDPLSQIKQEPKTPLKNANETIAFIDSEDTNNDKNESTKTQTELQDPLEAMDDDDDDDSLSSENQEIMQNYDSILNDLNKSNKIKTKTCDISLNIDKKSKKKDKNSLVDELNLTQVKSKKKVIKKIDTENKVSKEQDNSKNDQDSSDSIDLHLLFSEDSNDSESKKKKMADNEDKSTPIKKSKSIIVEEDINDQSGNVSLKQSGKKNKKRKSQLEKAATDTEDDNVGFFIDTEGTHNDTLNKSHNKSLKNNKDSIMENVDTDTSDSDENSSQEEPAEFNASPKKGNKDSTLNKSLNKSMTKTPGSAKKTTPKKVEQHVSDSSDSDAPMEISFKKNKQGSKVQETIEVSQDDNEPKLNKSLNKSLAKTPVSEKKKKIIQSTEENEQNNVSLNISVVKTPKSAKKSLGQDVDAIDHSNNTFIEKSFNKSIAKTPISEKKKQNTLIKNVEDDENVELTTPILNTSVGAKKKKKSISELPENNSVHEEQDNQYDNLSLIKSPGSNKKTIALTTKSPKLADNDSHSETLFNRSVTKTPGSERKKNKSISEDIESHNVLQKSMTKTPGSERKKNKSISEDIESHNVLQKSMTKTPGSERKKNKSISEDIESHNVLQKSITKTPGSVRKKNKSISEDSNDIALNISTIKTPGSEKKNVSDSKEDPEKESKKRKRKLSLTPQVEESSATVEDVQAPLLNESLVRNKKKKRKISQQETNEVTIQANKIEVENSDNLVKVDVPKKQKSKKRKEREDDEGNNITKISKQNSFEKAPVSRLPTSVLEQLDDKPQPKTVHPKSKKLKAISTTDFIVEETIKRKAKPSNYLEESVYLDDDDIDECKKKKSKGKIIKPKVLPFVPTASISNQGYTTTFKVNIIPKETKFVAQASTVDNFKNDYLYNKKIKRQGTYELYKRNRNLKLSKF